jgi:hypothetical protein
VRRLAGFDLAAREFPIASPDFVGGTFGEEEGVVGALQNGGSDLNYFCLWARIVQWNVSCV